MRFLDSRPDEQERLITMKASSVQLNFSPPGRATHWLNLVDSPGHIDFSSEVSAAIRLSDGAVIVVDIIDGVTMQTQAMLRHAFLEGLGMCLFINKFDLLFTTLQCTASEAYNQVRDIIQNCNVVLSAFANELELAGDTRTLLKKKRYLQGFRPSDAPPLDVVEQEEDEQWFSPAKGNVVMGSCLDGFGFSPETFSALYQSKFPAVTPARLAAALWGNFFMDSKTMTVSDRPRRENQPVLAVQLMFEPIWALYNEFLRPDAEVNHAKVEQMTTKLGAPLTLLRSTHDPPRTKLCNVLRHCWPLGSAVLRMVCDSLPSPCVGQAFRFDSLMDVSRPISADMRHAIATCRRDAETLVFVAKLIDAETSVAGCCGYGERKHANLDDAFFGFARVFTGCLKTGMILNVGDCASTVTVTNLFVFHGQGLHRVDEVPAGGHCAIGNLLGVVTKQATLCSAKDFPVFLPMRLMSSSILRISISPAHTADFSQLAHGLMLLNKIDPQVELTTLPSGEQVICCAGEVHAERCIEDLKTTFARVDVIVSAPLVSYRETLADVTKRVPVAVTVTGGSVAIKVSALSLPPAVLEALMRGGGDTVDNAPALTKLLGVSWKGPSHVVAYGPSKFGLATSFLLDGTVLRNGLLPRRAGGSDTDGCADAAARSSASNHSCEAAGSVDTGLLATHRDAIISGFQYASASGPMCEEPICGVAFVIEDVFDQAVHEGASPGTGATTGGSVMQAAAQACRLAFSVHSQQQRIVEPVAHCRVISAGQTQGKIYSLLNRRRASIIEEVPHEGSDVFHIHCTIPFGESFGLQDQLRIATSGAAMAYITMSHWAVIEDDPFFKPTTKEEVEEHGAQAVRRNVAAAIVEAVKLRKGMIRKQVVNDAEKQKFSTRGA